MGIIWTILSCLYYIAGPCVTLLYPLYASMEAIKSMSMANDVQWLAYWIIYSFLTLFEMVAGPLLALIPLWYTAKLIFVTWLVLPQFRGSSFIYKYAREQLKLFINGGQKGAAKQVNNPPSSSSSPPP